jgi:hypothetical protein
MRREKGENVSELFRNGQKERVSNFSETLDNTV